MKTLNDPARFIWDGDADKANKIFGENYGIDWEYVPGCLDIKVNGKIYKIGDGVQTDEIIKP